MTDQEIIDDMQKLYFEIAPDLFVDDDGKFDESITFTGSDLQSIMGDKWAGWNGRNSKVFGDFLNERGWEAWEEIKRKAFPDAEIYGW